MQKADIAVIGLAVMGQNLILNMNDNSYKVVAYNRTISKVDDFINGAAKNTNIVGAHSIEEMLSHLEKPRKIMLMVKAGDVVDNFINALVPHLSPEDIIIDGGNSLYSDTQRRVDELSKKGILYIGMGISGGEEGARNGPSIMPGGSHKAWLQVKHIYQKIAAKTPENEICCEWVGSGGAGHFVKMVHNGIEYGDMQLICEAYQIMKDLLGLNNQQISDIFNQFNKGDLKSYLIEITANILKFKDSNGYVVDNILDTAGQKGTGKWTAINALEFGTPLTLIAESVFARFISSQKDTRIKASTEYGEKNYKTLENNQEIIKDIEQTLLFAKIISYTQGYMLMKEASDLYGWDLDYGAIAMLWREGCIIRSSFLNDIKNAYKNNNNLENMLFDDYFKQKIIKSLSSVRNILSIAIKGEVPIPCLSAALAFYDSFTTKNLPANLLQAQRDYFGAHTYERVNSDRGLFFHTDWLSSQTNVSSSSYDA